ncbi:hypothetical protein BC834DRAFT_876659 [Gloeopeniophorella convolvens]|nr:hypothetical protein BC834DRAFT_876659 [Gloeopeniophorella convolvens]
MTVSTTSAAVYITPVVIKTFFQHAKRKQRRLREGKRGHEVATDDILFDEAYHIVKAFIELGTMNTIDSLQAFTNTHVPAPFWAAVAPIRIPLASCNTAADTLIDWFGPDDLVKVVGGERWWQVRGLDGIDAEWITERKYLDGEHATGDKKHSSSEETISRMDKLESVMLYVHGGGYFWGSINTHRYQIIRYARKFKGRAFAVNYRKAPQYPWPCPLHDVLAAYFYLTRPPPGAPHQPVDPAKLVFAGDSAGGGLCLSAIAVLRDMGLPQPAGAVLISPWVDLTHSFDSVMSNTATDIMPPYGFVHRPSATWPPDPVIDGPRARAVPTQTNPPPPPGHADTLAPTAERVEEQGHLRAVAAMTGTSLDTAERAEKGPVQDQGEMEAEVGSDRVSSNAGRDTAAEDRAASPDPEEADRWEPKPPKVLMKDPNDRPLELRSQIQQYATNEQLTHPLVSPVLQGSLCNLCPLYILAGDGEVLRDEIVYLAHRAAHPDDYPVRKGVLAEGRRQRENAEKFRAPTKVHLQVYDGMPHVLTVFSFTDSAKYAYRSIAQFVRHVTLHSADHIARNPFPELHRPECEIHMDHGHSPEPELEKHEKPPRRWLPHRSKKPESHKEQADKEGVVSDVQMYKDNEAVTAEEVRHDEVEKVPGNSETQDQEVDEMLRQGPSAPADIPHILMIRERVDIFGRVRPMEPPEEIAALRMRPADVGLIKEAPVRRWLDGQAHMDKVYGRYARSAMRKRAACMAKAERMLIKAREGGLVLEQDEEDGGAGGDGDGMGSQMPAASRVRGGGVRMASADSDGSATSGQGPQILEERRWGPLDLTHERPPPSAIAGRRDTPEALRLLKMAIYHSAPTTHRTVPTMTRAQAVRATLDPDDSGVTAPAQSASEQQVHTHMTPLHGLAIWNSLVVLFMRKSAKGKRHAADLLELTVNSSPVNALSPSQGGKNKE